MLLGQVPAAYPKHEQGVLLLDLVMFAVGIGEFEAASVVVVDVLLAFQGLPPGWGVRVFKIRHEDFGAGIERVDHHFAVYGASNLYSPILHLRRDGGDAPVAIPHCYGLGEEVEALAASVDCGLALLAAAQELDPTRVEARVQFAEEVLGGAGEDAGAEISGAVGDLDLLRHGEIVL